MNSVIHQQGQSSGSPAPLSPRDAFIHLQNDAAILDIRPEYETDFRVFDVPNIFYLPYRSYRDQFHLIPKDIPLIVADSVGNKSMEVARYLVEQNYPQVFFLAGGMVAWDRDGLPLSKDKNYAMVGGCACRLKPKSTQTEGSSVAPKV
ncbi:Rhodanese-related sulfurtransferase [Geosporobacter subterraneus DSM 17957]|uniref:Rhodanese-related sulfurtransferase n=1 Tax=Geosporobacter subterraneus DSM 17957 TaxID=1121919 RepID=A0A1M6PXQ6_9FIRM|nr:rhodanese-like domain-containing protein [Geosporobacter subterraneus]SHK12677.1 Rhodanese-related sulfurtransferase [Geosporobacter subterraneus DSM 17957]